MAHLLALPLLLVLLAAASPPLVVPGLGAAAADEHEYTLVKISSLKPKSTCSGHRVSPPQNSSWVPLHHPHGPCSPASSNAAAPPSLAELLHLDHLRVLDIHTRLSDSPLDDSKKRAATGPSIQLHGNLMQVGAGTTRGGSRLSTDAAAAAAAAPPPGVVQTVVMDTASDVPWVRCVRCRAPPCPPQTYDPARSATYAAVPCNSTACARLGRYANGCVNNQCQYRVVSPDGLTSSGTYSTDVLTLGAASSVRAFQFGCSSAERGSLGAPGADGIMSLGGGAQSLLAQTATRYGNAFSYCIAPTASTAGFFALGVPLQAASRYAVTPMLADRRSPTFHRVLLRDIAVAGRRLGVPPAVFAAGSVMDSRTTITRLPPTAYRALRAAFRRAMSGYRPAPPQGSLDTCYDFRGVATVRLPTIALVFDRNAVVPLDPSGILFNNCLAFIPNANDSMSGIIGSLQQQTLEVFYNVGGRSVGFRRAAC